jgi:hypothetical protein
LSFLVGQSLEASEDQWLGGRVFQAFMVILTGASIAFIPLYVGVRLAGERQEANLDLLYVTTLTPQRIIRGKFLCGAYMAVLFFSACMPFMVFTNLLRGIDLPTIFFILICLFLAVCAAVQTAIFLACLPLSRLLKILLGIFCLISLVPIAGSLLMAFYEMARSGVGSMMGSPDFWINYFTALSVAFGIVLLLYFLSVALISPPSANRALPLRSYVTGVWLFTAALGFYWTCKLHDARPMLPWAVVSFILLAGAMLVIISNHDTLSLRVRRDIPLTSGKRALAFLFYNGAAGGLIWLVLLIGLTFMGAFGLQHLNTLPFGSTSLHSFSTLEAEDLFNTEMMTGTVLLYGLAYGLTALFLHRRFFRGRSPKVAGILAVLLPGAWAIIPNLLYFFLNRLSWSRLEQCQLGNIFNVFVVKDIGQKQMHLVCALAWLVIIVVLNARWFILQAKAFQPLHRHAEPPILPIVK